MAIQLLRKNEQKLKTYYNEINRQNNEHIGQQKVREWLGLVIEDRLIIVDDIAIMIKQKIVEQFEQWVAKYLNQVANQQTENMSRIEFGYGQCVLFLQWLLKLVSQNEDVQKENEQSENNQEDLQKKQQQQAKDDQYNTQQENVQNKVQQLNQDQDEDHHQQQKDEEQQQQQAININQKDNNNNHYQQIVSHSPSHKTNQNQKQKSNHQQQQIGLFQQLTNSQPVNSIIDKLNKHSRTKQSHQQNIMKLPQQDQRYKQYIQTIFQHYCKINFGLAKDNTFESMQKHVSIMTINKFMIFANDFQIPILVAASMPKQGKQKLNKIQIRNLLMDVFKKNSLFHKQMNFEQFLQSILKIGQISFVRMKNHQYYQSQQNTTKFSYQMIKMINYLEISHFKEFKQKMTKLNINFSLKFNKQLQEKKAPVNYKFKYDVEQIKKVQQFAKPPIPMKKKSQKKDNQENFFKKRPQLQIAKPLLNKKVSTPHIPRIGERNKTVGQVKSGSTKILPSQFTHDTTQNQRKERNIIPFQNNKKNGKSVEKLNQAIRSPQPVIQGYVNIHLAKKGLLSLDQNKNSLTGIRKKGEFQLNNVIQEARKQTQTKVYYDYQDSRRSERAMSNLSNSKPMSQYSRDPVSNQSHRIVNNRQDIQIQMVQNDGNVRSNKNIKNQGYLKKSSLDPHNQLRNLIDFNESDEDEYLDQHLKKEKDHETQMDMRVEKRISQFNYKI